MYIGEISTKTGLSIQAIRFYEEKQLIPTPQRSGRYRVYTESDIELLVLIKEARNLGVSLSQLKGVIILKNDTVDWQKISVFMKDLRLHLVDQIAELKSKIEKIDDCCRRIDS